MRKIEIYFHIKVIKSSVLSLDKPDGLPLGRGGGAAGEAGDDVVLEHKLLQAGLAVGVVALQDLEGNK